LLPWQAMGLDGPPASGKIKIEISASTWLKARWMSLSGLPPRQDSADPTRWTEMRLGAK
jgi:hypothetical protein